MDVQFVTSVAPIVRDAEASRSFYADALGLGFEGQDGDYVFTHELEGTKHFGLWHLSEAANACFGTPEWPGEVPVPQASIEFEVADVAAAAAELTAKGYRLIHDARTEPWGQITARLLSPEGLLVAVCLLPGVSGRIGQPLCRVSPFDAPMGCQVPISREVRGCRPRGRRSA